MAMRGGPFSSSEQSAKLWPWELVAFDMVVREPVSLVVAGGLRFPPVTLRMKETILFGAELEEVSWPMVIAPAF